MYMYVSKCRNWHLTLWVKEGIFIYSCRNSICYQDRIAFSSHQLVTLVILQTQQHQRMEKKYLSILGLVDFLSNYIHIYRSTSKKVIRFSLALNLIFWLWNISDWLVKICLCGLAMLIIHLFVEMLKFYPLLISF